MRNRIILCPILLLMSISNIHSSTLSSSEKNTKHKMATYGFEENKGQVLTIDGKPAPFVRYSLVQGSTYIFLLDNGIAYQFNKSHYPDGYEALAMDASHNDNKRMEFDLMREQVTLETYRMDMVLEGGDPQPRITTKGRSADYTNYYTKNALDVHTYTSVTYHDVYPGIDWMVYITAIGMKYDFIVHPGADPSMITMRFSDSEELYVDSHGNLVHGNRMGQFIEKKPISLQGSKEIDTRFLIDGNSVHFEINTYDRSVDLTIDPERIWGTYYGGTSVDFIYSCTVDSNGNIFLCGNTNSTNAISFNGHQNIHAGDFQDSFLVKFAPNGERLWGTYYGGDQYDWGSSCSTDMELNVYLSGSTSSSSGISSNGHQSQLGGLSDAFLVKFNSEGARLWATYYGGSYMDEGRGCNVDIDGNVYLCGFARSTEGISYGGHQNEYGGWSRDAFLAKFDSEGNRLWGTYYGGSGSDIGSSCTSDANGNVYLSGLTTSINSIASGGHQNNHGGGAGDTFLAKFNTHGVRVWATYYGGSNAEEGFGTSTIVDNHGNVFLAGQTSSTNGIAAGGHQNTYGGDGNGDIWDAGDSFLVKFDPDGNRLWGTYYGGAEEDAAFSCATDGEGNVYVAGQTKSNDAIASLGHENPDIDDWDAFIAKFDTDGTRLWGMYYGGDMPDYGRGCAADTDGSVILAGITGSSLSPPYTAIASGGHQNEPGGTIDAFLVKFEGNGVGISEEQIRQSAINIFPSPTRSVINITFAQGSLPYRVSVLDAIGRVVLTQATTRFTESIAVDLNESESGLYFVQVNFVDGTSDTVRVVKE